MPLWLKHDDAAIDRLADAIAGTVACAGFRDVRQESRAARPARCVAVVATR
jgi:hypothetical protein